MILIAQHLSNDFATDEFSDHYDYLPQQAYQFTVVLIGAIAKAYTSTRKLSYHIFQCFPFNYGLSSTARAINLLCRT